MTQKSKIEDLKKIGNSINELVENNINKENIDDFELDNYVSLLDDYSKELLQILETLDDADIQTLEKKSLPIKILSLDDDDLGEIITITPKIKYLKIDTLWINSAQVLDEANAQILSALINDNKLGEILVALKDGEDINHENQIKQNFSQHGIGEEYYSIE